MPPHSSSPVLLRRQTPSPIMRKKALRRRKRSPTSLAPKETYGYIQDNLSGSSSDAESDSSGRLTPELSWAQEVEQLGQRCCASLVKIVEWDHAPDYLKFNPYIRSGYRFGLNDVECLKSLFWWTNETLNIWTHFIGWMLHLGLTLRDHVQIAPEIFGPPSVPDMEYTDRVLGVLVSICFQCCTGLSTLYHIFHCRSAESFQCWLGRDLLGISASLLGIFISGMYYAFWCESSWMTFYLLMSTCMYAISMSVQLLPVFLDKKYDKTRTLVFFSWAASGTIPLCHWAITNGGIFDHLVLTMVSKVGMMYVLCGVAFFFYLTKFPERLFPGKVDFVGASHQWWHIWIVIAFYHWHHAVLDFVTIRMNHGCFECSLNTGA